MLNKLTLKQAIDQLDNKKITLEDVWADVLDAIKDQNDQLNVYLALNKNFKSQLDKPLKGLPIAVKDNFCTKDMTTTASSLLLKDFMPQFESTVT